jgi:Fe-S-cluster containining protein
MDVPIRKRLKPMTEEEKIFWIERTPPDLVNGLLDDYEANIPIADVLEKDIEEKFDKLNGKPVDLMKKFYEYVDRWGDVYKKYAPCKKGCSKCCSEIPVAISKIEVLIIRQYIDKNKLKYIFKNDVELKKNNSKGLVGYEYMGKKCPFLINNECHIYFVRPFRCRNYFIVGDDNSKCGAGDNLVTTHKSYITEKTYEKIIEYYYERKRININQLSIFEVYNDIRDNFDVANYEGNHCA